jgi:hypothetical protein
MKTKYRVDFSRLARTAEEILLDKSVTDFLSRFVPAAKLNFMPDGHVLDSVTIEDEDGMTGPEIMKSHVLPSFPEAKLMSWDVCRNAGEINPYSEPHPAMTG